MRFQKTAAGRAALVGCGLLVAALFVGIFAGGILRYDCPILAFTGIPCPGCGMTRAFASLMQLRLADALAFNPMVLLMLVYGGVAVAAYVSGKQKILYSRLFWIVFIVFMMGFWAVRLILLFMGSGMNAVDMTAVIPRIFLQFFG